ncbi:MAG: hypothetical protein H6579_00745 [Chitinophagales bacterium]|nr:hypothetical protein [Chitinophagales bacterium]
MKNSILILIAVCSFALFSFTLPGEEANYNGGKVTYNVEKSNGVVMINLGLQNPQEYAEIIVMRSDNPAKFFREVKYLGGEAIDGMSSSNVIIDKYPLPSKITSYYKIQTIDKNGVQKSYPSVRLSLN